MHNLDDMIEKYRYELMEFSKQNPIHTESEEEPLEVVAANTQPIEQSIEQPVEQQANEFDTEVDDYVVLQPYADYADFERRNGSQGKMKVQVFAADRSFPVGGARITVSVPLVTGSREIFSGVTDMDGIVDDILLPAPGKSLSLDENNTAEPFALYNLKVSHPDFAVGEYANIPVFDSVKSIQPVELVPRTQSGNAPGDTEFGGVV